IVGCLTETYFLLVQRFYVNGKMEQVLAMHGVLLYLAYASLAIFALGLLFALLQRKKRPQLGIAIAAMGAFLAVANFGMRVVYPAATSVLCVVVPIMTLLGIVFFLYQREFFYGVSVLGLAICNLWACRKGLASGYWHNKLLIATGVVVLLFLLVLLVVHKIEDNKGKWKTKKLFPAGTEYDVIYGSCLLSIVALVLCVFSATIAYYAMWALAVCLFALAVYYTIKQL
ncbi:MAG: hypothetical protein RRZ93_06275, partial [Ruthenibacterium sp.]